MEYTFKWMNQGGITESGMDMWIVTLHNDQGNPVKTIKNSEATNLQNFSEVIIKMNLTYDEAMSQTVSNTARVFFDSESTDTQLTEMNVLFDRTQVPLNIEDIEKVDYDTQGYDFKIPSGAMHPDVRGLPAKKFSNFINHEYLHTRPFKFNAYDMNSIFIYKEDTEGYITFWDEDDNVLATHDEQLSRTELDPNDIYKVKLWYWTKTEGEISGPFEFIIEDKRDKEYWISTFIGRPYEIPTLSEGDIFTCKSNDPIGTEGEYTYKLGSGGEMKWISNGTDTTGEPQDCADLTYTGVQKFNMTTNSRCGPNHGNMRCAGNQCCSRDGWCGGSVGRWSDWCSRFRWDKDRDSGRWMYIRGKWTWVDWWTYQYSGWYDMHDGGHIGGRPLWSRESTNNVWNDKTQRLIQDGDILRCRHNDPLGKDNETTYKYTGNNTIKSIPTETILRKIVGTSNLDVTFPSVGMVVHNCANVKYGGAEE